MRRARCAKTFLPSAASLAGLLPVAVAFVLLGPDRSSAADHREAVLIVDEGAAAVIHVPPLAQSQDLLWSGAPLVAPSDAILGADGSLLIADPGADTIFRFDWAAGIQPEPFVPLAADTCWIEVQQPGEVLSAGPAGLFRTDTTSGVASRVPAMLDTPFDIGLLPDGTVLVADPGLQGLVRVDPQSGDSSTFSSGGFNCWIDVGAQGLVVAVGADGVFLVAPGGGDPQLLTSGGFLSDPSAVAFGAHGDIYVADRGASAAGFAATNASIVRVDPNGGQFVIASGGFLSAPSAVLVVETGEVPLLPGGLGSALLLLGLSFVAWRRIQPGRGW